MAGPAVYGPYRHKRGWRIVILEQGARRTLYYADEREAREEVTRVREAIANKPKSIGNLLDAYEEYQRLKGNRLSSISTGMFKLRGLFGPALHLELVRLTPTRAQALYDEFAKGRSPATHRNTLNMAKTFVRWAMKRGSCQRNVLERVEAYGAVPAGKEQLRVDETRKVLDACLAVSPSDLEEYQRAVGAMCTFLLALRAGEILRIRARDVDDDGRLLWIERGKTKNARRTLPIPTVLQPGLQLLAAVAGNPDTLLFPFASNWPRAQVWRYCDLAGVRRVSAHAMRGFHATTAYVGGHTAETVAAALGHGGPAVTRRAYIAPGSEERAGVTRVLTVMDGGKSRTQPFPPGEVPIGRRKKAQ